MRIWIPVARGVGVGIATLLITSLASVVLVAIVSISPPNGSYSVATEKLLQSFAFAVSGFASLLAMFFPNVMFRKGCAFKM